VRVKSKGVQIRNPSNDVQWLIRQWEHPTVGTEQLGHPFKPCDDVSGFLPQRFDDEIAKRMPANLALTGKAMLHNTGPGSPPDVIAAQRGQCHSQVAWRDAAEFSAQPAAAPSVV
jgi:hypothetical protein